MKIDDNVLDLLLQCEQLAAQGKTPDLGQVAAGDAKLMQQLKRHWLELDRIAWIAENREADVALPLPDKESLEVAMSLPMGLTIEQLQTNIAKADVVDPFRLQQLLLDGPPRNSIELSRRLLESELLTRFQLKAIAHGRTRGLKLGRYLILDRLGEGGMGQVFKARHNKMGRTVAVKVLPRDAMSKNNSIARFGQEVSVASRLNHPNIVTAFDADEAEGLHFLVMEYVPGRDLSSIVRRNGPLSTLEAVDCILQTARGLEYAHGVRLVHRDIKPANLLRDENGVVKILDMGIARIHGEKVDETYSTARGGVVDSQLTQIGAVMGTVDYMAPEQAIDAKSVDGRADIYSLGCTLYFLLTGRPPFPGDTLMEKLYGHRDSPPPPLESKLDSVSPALEAIYQKCMAKRPEERYPDASGLLFDIANLHRQLLNDSKDCDLLPADPEIRKLEAGALEVSAQVAPSYEAPSQTPAIVNHFAVASQVVRKRRESKTRSYAFYGSAVVVILLLLGGYYSYSAIFDAPLPNGNLLLQFDVEELLAHSDDQILTIVNRQTNESSPIQLNASNRSFSLPPGEYDFQRSANDPLRTDSNEVTISSGENATVRVFWSSPDQVASRTVSAVDVTPGSVSPPSASPPQEPRQEALWIDLLTLVKIPDHVIFGRWDRRGETLVGESGFARRFLAPYAVKGSYVLEMEFTRTGKVDGLGVCLPVGDVACNFSLDWCNGMFSGLQTVGGKFLQEQSSHASSIVLGNQIKTGERQKLSVQVLVDEFGRVKVTADLDGRRLISWEGNKDQLQNPHVTPFPLSQAPGVFVYDTTAEVHALRLKHIDNGKGQQLGDDWGHPFFEVADVPPNDVAPRCEEWNGRAYYFSSSPMLLAEAQQFAKRFRARLLTISSAEEDEYIRGKTSGKNVWMSGWQVNGNNKWRDERNRPLQYIGKWTTGNPDNKDGIEGYLGLQQLGSEQGWNDFSALQNGIYPVLEWGEEYPEGTQLADLSSPGQTIASRVDAMVRPDSIDDQERNWEYGEWRSIFNGYNLQGWLQVGKPGWRVENGVLIGDAPASGWLLFTQRTGNYELELEYRLSKDGDSGICLSGAIKGETPTGPHLEVQLADDSSPRFANSPRSGLTGAIFGVAGSKPLSPIVGPDEWRPVSIRHDGQTTVVTISGQEVVRYSAESRRDAGRIGFQRMNGRIEFRNIRLREFDTPINN